MLNEAYEKLMKSGGIGVIPTDTVYGVVARAVDELAVDRLYKLKHRKGKPGTLIASDINQLEELGLKRRYLNAVEQFWPGPLSVVIPTSNPDLKYLDLGKLSLAVRVPDQKELLALLKKTGPLLTSSANKPDEPTSVNIIQARAYFENDVDFYINGGSLSDHKPSTIIRVLDDAIEVLRQGAVKIDHNDKI
jgi:L-threonylcarbamoyladenylate synthase